MATTNQTFTSTGSWVAPIGVTTVQVELRAPGGGTGGITTDTFAIGGAAGGQYVKKNAFTVVPGTSYTVTIGAVGAAGSATGPTDGTAGGNTWFSTNDANGVVAKGGAPSLANSRTKGSGSTAGGVGDVVNAGGNGADSATTNGGGGGEGGGSSGTGGNASGTTGGSGTDGGNGGAGATNGVGGAATNYGGGGGGSASTGTNNRAGRAGAAGNAVLTWTTPLISALTDNFNDNSIDGAKWTNTDAVNLVEANGEIEITTTLTPFDANLYSDVYDITGSQATIKVIDAGNQALTSYSLWFLVYKSDFSNDVRWAITNGNIEARNQNTVVATTTYIAVTHRYLKIRESGGNTYWDYSSDGVSWTNFTSHANYFVMTAIRYNIEATTSGVELSATTAKVDNFNIIPTAALTGTATASITEADIVSGGKTIILTLTNDTWIAAGAGSFDLQRQNIINGLTSAQSEATGWNLVPKALQGVAGVVRTSDTVVTITLDAFATYNITATETITATIPATALTGAVAIVASPTFDITVVGGGTPYTLNFSDSITSSDSRKEDDSRKLTDTLSSSDSKKEDITRKLLDTITSLDLKSELLGRSLLDIISSSDSKKESISRILSDTISSTDSKIEAITRLLKDSITSSDSKSSGISRNVGDSMLTSDSRFESITRGLSDSQALVDSTIKSISRMLVDSISLSDSLFYVEGKYYFDTVGLTDSILLRLIRALLCTSERLRIKSSQRALFFRSVSLEFYSCLDLRVHTRDGGSLLFSSLRTSTVMNGQRYRLVSSDNFIDFGNPSGDNRLRFQDPNLIVDFSDSSLITF